MVIINEGHARFYFGNRNPIGRTVRFSAGDPFEIVGVVKDFVRGTPRGASQEEFFTYFPYRDREALNRGAQSRLRVMMVAVRTAGDPRLLTDTVRRELRAIDPDLPVLHINTASDQLEDVLAQERLLAALSSFFGGAAVVLACMGVFGVLSYGVARRTTEIGVRIAMGATQSGVVGMILSESLRPVVAGILVGLPLAFVAGRYIGGQLYHVGTSDPATIAAAGILVVAVATMAAYLPARRASRIEPMSALRSE